MEILIGIAAGAALAGMIIGIALYGIAKKVRFTKRANDANIVIKNEKISKALELLLILAQRNGLSENDAFKFLKELEVADEKSALINKVQYSKFSKKDNVSAKQEAKTTKLR